MQTVEAEVENNQQSKSKKRRQIGWQKCGGSPRRSMAMQQRQQQHRDGNTVTMTATATATAMPAAVAAAVAAVVAKAIHEGSS